MIKPMILAGRCTSGAQRGGGQKTHALPDGTREFSHDKALCGAAPGRLSVGWVDPVYAEVTCTRCLKKISGD